MDPRSRPGLHVHALAFDQHVALGPRQAVPDLASQAAITMKLILRPCGRARCYGVSHRTSRGGDEVWWLGRKKCFCGVRVTGVRPYSGGRKEQTFTATPTRRPISSARVHLDQNGHKSRPNAPTQTDARPLFIRLPTHSRPKFEPHLRRRGHEADAPDARLLLPLAR